MCILLVEDEGLIREFLANELDFQGFDVCEAETGDQAAALIKNPPKVFSLLITDVHMPGKMSGIEVGRLMRLHHPRLPIIYTTGRPDTLNAIGPLGPKEALVAKPYSPTAMVDVARRLLAAVSPVPRAD
jgi:DNA-binding response OmpR family regulator